MLRRLWKNYRFPIILFISIILGSIVGIIFKDNAKVLEPLGQIFVNMLFVIVIPLVFFTVSSSIANMTSLKRLGKIFKYMFIIFVITSLIASVFMLFGVFLFKPTGTIIDNLEYTKESINIGEQFVSMLTVSDFFMLLSKSNMLPLIIFSCIFGFSVKLCGNDSKIINDFLNAGCKVMLKMINIVMYYAPIGLLAYFASLVGTYGPELLGSYAKCFIVYIVIGVLYYVIFYSMYCYIAYRKRGIKVFYKNILLSTITSLGTCSSLASLPSNMNTADKMGLPKDVNEVVLPIGATIHMEGSSMASIMKIAFLFSVFGRSFNGVSDILLALVVAVLSGVVMSGIPGGGLIGEALIVSLYGFPSLAFPIISTIGWLVDSPATCLNVVGDIPSCMLISKLVDNDSPNYK